jgi:beta-lactamase regulating signal transducer with metallopeptidase domain
MEVDCDARVLGRGEKVKAYGEMLLAVGERRTLMPVGAIALTEPASQLLQRVRIMTADVPSRGK